MARRAGLSNTFTKGVIDPALSERVDIKHYYDSLESGLNIEVFPQGGFRRRAGTTTTGVRLRRTLQPVHGQPVHGQPVHGTLNRITTPNGGNSSTLLDQNNATLFTTNDVSGSLFIVFQIDLGEPVSVVMVDLLGYRSKNLRFGRAIEVQYWDGNRWAPFGTPLLGLGERTRKALSTSERTRRFATPPGSDVSAQVWRVVAHSAVGAGPISIRGLRMLSERRQISTVRGYTFARTSDIVYEMILTDRNIDVFTNFQYQGSIAVDIDRRQIADVNVTQSLDTMLLYHEDVHSVRITRQGADDEWNSVGAEFTNVPDLTPGTAFSGNQDEVQEVDLGAIQSGQQFVLWLEGRVTSPITYAEGVSGLQSVHSALVAIGVGGGLRVLSLANGNGFRLDFAGDAGARRWPVAFATVLDDDDTEPRSFVLQRGVLIGAPIMHERTGWPRCGVFYQERQLLGGFRSAPLSFGVSRFGQEFDFTDDGDPLTADLAFFGTLNSPQVETIHEIYVGRHIQLFTEAGEWYMEARALDATQPPNVLLATRYGMKATVPLQFADGATLFVQKGGRVLRDMVYSDVELSYRADPLSLLGPHLLTDVIDVGFRSARSTDEGNQIFLVNADGSIAFMPLLRDQEVVGTAPWKTDGFFRGAFGDVLQRIWLITERATVARGSDHYLELLDGSHTLDAAIIPGDTSEVSQSGGATGATFAAIASSFRGVAEALTGEAPAQQLGNLQLSNTLTRLRAEVAGLARRARRATMVVDGLEMHEDKEVWAWADGHLLGPFLVTSARITLPIAATDITVGLFPLFHARLPRLREQLQNGYPWRPPARIYEAGLSIAGTGQLDMAVNGGPFREVPLDLTAKQALEFVLPEPRTTAVVDSGASAAGEMERLIRAITMIPGSGEFAYATSPVTRTFEEFGHTVVVKENVHGNDDQADMLLSLGQMTQALPNIENVSLFVSWFGSDLRAPNCTIRPKVDQTAGENTWAPYDWVVSGLNRRDAQRVSLTNGQVNYGGSPADQSVIEGIRAIKAQGNAVTLTPFLVMDIPAGNNLPNPYGGSSQPAHPWRGRITSNIAQETIEGAPEVTRQLYVLTTRNLPLMMREVPGGACRRDVPLSSYLEETDRDYDLFAAGDETCSLAASTPNGKTLLIRILDDNDNGLDADQFIMSDDRGQLFDFPYFGFHNNEEWSPVLSLRRSGGLLRGFSSRSFDVNQRMEVDEVIVIDSAEFVNVQVVNDQPITIGDAQRATVDLSEAGHHLRVSVTINGSLETHDFASGVGRDLSFESGGVLTIVGRDLVPSGFPLNATMVLEEVTAARVPGRTISDASAQVAAFVGVAEVEHFSPRDNTVIYGGSAEWSYRRFILHYAHLAKLAGGVDTFVIGSEMRGLTWLRDGPGSYPFVVELVRLAADVREILPDVNVTYAADWTEFTPHQTGQSGELFFHLDPLWSSPNITAIGIDNYWPLSDWRSGDQHLDYLNGHRSIYERGYLQGNIEGGELYDWFYASKADRDAQKRSPITDGAYGKAWVYRVKDIRNWWLNRHHNRPGGAEAELATAWVPQSKPIWFMELGCPAIDRGANQPNVFVDPKSSESFRPYYSRGHRDDQMQRAYIQSLLAYYLPGQTGFEEKNNPISDVTGQRMVDFHRLYAYTWDARFYPAFPRLTQAWSDGALWQFGHWLTGRLFLTRVQNPSALPVGYSPDLPTRDSLVTATVRVTNLRGFSRNPTLELSQRIPAPLEVRAIRYEVAYNG